MLLKDLYKTRKVEYRVNDYGTNIKIIPIVYENDAFRNITPEECPQDVEWYNYKTLQKFIESCLSVEEDADIQHTDKGLLFESRDGNCRLKLNKNIYSLREGYKHLINSVSDVNKVSKSVSNFEKIFIRCCKDKYYKDIYKDVNKIAKTDDGYFWLDGYTIIQLKSEDYILNLQDKITDEIKVNFNRIFSVYDDSKLLDKVKCNKKTFTNNLDLWYIERNSIVNILHLSVRLHEKLFCSYKELKMLLQLIDEEEFELLLTEEGLYYEKEGCYRVFIIRSKNISPSEPVIKYV